MNFLRVLVVFFLVNQPVFAQPILRENLSNHHRLYFDAERKKIKSEGSYYVSDKAFQYNKEEKHGKWKFYSLEGILEEERMYFRDRVHGRQLRYHENGKIKSESYFKFNVPDSLYKEYNALGGLIIEGQYDMGSADGYWKYYYDDGAQKSEQFIRNDTIYLLNYWDSDTVHVQTITEGEGYLVAFYTNGTVREKYTFHNGLKNGLFVEKTANGQTAIEGNFENGLKSGKWKFFSIEGALEKEMNFKKDTLHGNYKVFYENNLENTVGQYAFGKKAGKWQWNFPDGKIEMQGQFTEDQQHGTWIYNYPSGNISYKANFRNGRKHGTWEYFYEAGEPFKKGDYSDDQKEEVWTTWYENGRVLIEGKFKKGKESGTWFNYWEDGMVKNQTEFKNGVLHGSWKSYTPNGILITRGKYTNGLKSGIWQDYFSNGQVMQKSGYKIVNRKHGDKAIANTGKKQKTSELHGKFESYSSEDFRIRSKGVYKKGLKHGTWLDFYPGGLVPMVLAQYKNGNLHGMMRRYDRRGTLLSEINFKKGRKDGWFLVFSSNGQIKIRKFYSNGVEVTKKGDKDLFSP